MIEWETASGLIPLKSAIETMEKRVVEIHQCKKNQLIWLLEHPHVYSGGTSANKAHLLARPTIPVEQTGRGGSYTYHGPGQRIIYVMMDLTKQEKDIRKFVWNLEQWVIDTLVEFNIFAERRKNRVGIWVINKKNEQYNSSPNLDLKIGSIGLRLKNWISYFGISINVCNDLSYFDGIIPCGNLGFGVTSIWEQGQKTSLTELDYVLKQKFNNVFNINNTKKKSRSATINTVET